MDKTTLKAEHPDLFAAIVAEGKEAGKAECLEVIEGHLALAAASGDNDRALEDIKAMKPITQAVMAHHTAAGIRNASIEARDEEAPPATGGGDPAPDAPESFAKEQAEINAMFSGVEVTF